MARTGFEWKEKAQRCYRHVRQTNGDRPFGVFSLFVSALIDSLVSEDELYQILGYPSEEKRNADVSDKAFFAQVNDYLSAENAPLIDIQAIKKMNPHFLDALRLLMDGKQLNMAEHEFNTGSEAKRRGQSQQAQARLGKFYRAISDYRIEKEPGKRADETGIRTWKLTHTEEPAATKAQLEEVDRVDFSQHTILFVPGMSCTHDRRQLIQDWVETLKLLAKTKSSATEQELSETSFYAISYPYEDRMSLNADIHEFNANPNEVIKPAVQQWVNAVLLPSLGLKEKKHERRPRALAVAFRKLNLFASSYGCVIALQMRNALAHRLLELGYEVLEIKDAMCRAHSLNVPPVCNIHVPLPETGSFSSVYVVAPGDLTAQSRTDYEALTDSEKPLPQSVDVNAHTLLIWRNAPYAGINLTRQMAQKDWVGEALFTPNAKSVPQPLHDLTLLQMDIMEPLAHGAFNVHVSAPYHDLLHSRGQRRDSLGLPKAGREWTEYERKKRTKAHEISG